MILQLLHFEFPYIWGKFDFIFYQCSSWPKVRWGVQMLLASNTVHGSSDGILSYKQWQASVFYFYHFFLPSHARMTSEEREKKYVQSLVEV